MKKAHLGFLKRGVKMGYFSWKCKGCEKEVREGQLVRLNGVLGEYDGYGRVTHVNGMTNTGDEDYQYGLGEPCVWHELCFKEATSVQKADESPSEYAPNQGLGDFDKDEERHFVDEILSCYDDSLVRGKTGKDLYFGPDE